jgi:hypothetical protein
MSGQEDIDELSRRLARTDFSADSRIRESLRAELLGKQRSRRFSPARVASLALAASAVALILLLPFRSRLRPGVAMSLETGVLLTSAPPREAAAKRAPAPERTLFPRDELGLPILPGRLAANGRSDEAPLIATLAVDRIIEIHRGRAIPRKDGRAVLWEIDGASYILETRRTSLDEIFETRAL